MSDLMSTRLERLREIIGQFAQRALNAVEALGVESDRLRAELANAQEERERMQSALGRIVCRAAQTMVPGRAGMWKCPWCLASPAAFDAFSIKHESDCPALIARAAIGEPAAEQPIIIADLTLDDAEDTGTADDQIDPAVVDACRKHIERTGLTTDEFVADALVRAARERKEGRS